jgi:hypothetical protein
VGQREGTPSSIRNFYFREPPKFPFLKKNQLIKNVSFQKRKKKKKLIKVELGRQSHLNNWNMNIYPYFNT